MTPDELKNRTKAFALDVIELYRRLPSIEPAAILGKQLVRAGTSVGANYRAVCRPKSDADFISKLGTVIEECDESGFWLELLIDAGCPSTPQTRALLKEADELTRIFVASRETVRRRIRAKRKTSEQPP
jgi:four helix bundle protein